MSLQSGDIIDGKYRIDRLIGEGGMGSVFEGENLKIHRRVAIKVLHARVAADDTMVRRFEREAQAAGRIGSKHIVEVLDLGELPNGDRYMVMEYLHGVSLKDRMTAGMTPAELLPIVLQLLDGLGDAHEAGIIHRDLKPANILLVKPTRRDGDLVKILDFGVSKFRPLEHDREITNTGAVIGTPHYMAPEQAKGGKVDHRADLFAVGVLMYRALSGRMPFEADNVNRLMFKVALEDAPPLEQWVPDIDPEVRAMVHKAMARDENERFQTAREFAETLEQWLEARGLSHLSISASTDRTPISGVAPGATPAGISGVTPPLGMVPASVPAKPRAAGRRGAAIGVALGMAVLGAGLAAWVLLGGPAQSESADAPSGAANTSEGVTDATSAAPTHEPTEPALGSGGHQPEPAPPAEADAGPRSAQDETLRATPPTRPTSPRPAGRPQPAAAPTSSRTGRKFRTELD